MSIFDKELWRNRARLRMERSKKKSKIALELFGRDLGAISGIIHVVDWCNERGLMVDFTKDPNGTYHPDDKRITINANLRPEAQLFLLLHECGHYLIDSCGIHHGTVMKADGARTRVARVEIINEEFEAWNRGRKLADRLNILINTERFNKLKADALSSYFSWAVRG